MEESQLGIEIAKGIKGAIQDFLAPDMRTIINELKHHTKLLDKHDQKLDKLSEGIQQLGTKQSEILTKLDLEKRVTELEMIVKLRREISSLGWPETIEKPLKKVKKEMTEIERKKKPL